MNERMLVLAAAAMLAGGCAANRAAQEEGRVAEIPLEVAAMYVGEARDGNRRICYYNRLGKTTAIAVRRTWDCPSSVHYDPRSIVEGRSIR